MYNESTMWKIKHYLLTNPSYHFKPGLQNVDQHRAGKLLIHHSTKHHKDNKLQCIERTCTIS